MKEATGNGDEMPIFIYYYWVMSWKTFALLIGPFKPHTFYESSFTYSFLVTLSLLDTVMNAAKYHHWKGRKKKPPQIYFLTRQ